MVLVDLCRVFYQLRKNGGADPSQLAAEISSAIGPVGIAALPGIVGYVLVVIALTRSRYREGWFFVVLVILSIFLMISYMPIGFLAGIVLLLMVLRRRSEFFPARD